MSQDPFHKTFDPTNATHPFGLTFKVELPEDTDGTFDPGDPANAEMEAAAKLAIYEHIQRICLDAGVDPSEVEISVGDIKA